MESVWLYEDSTPEVFSRHPRHYFAKGEPDHSGSCYYLSRGAHFKWADTYCDKWKKKQFVCQSRYDVCPHKKVNELNHAVSVMRLYANFDSKSGSDMMEFDFLEVPHFHANKVVKKIHRMPVFPKRMIDPCAVNYDYMKIMFLGGRVHDEDSSIGLSHLCNTALMLKLQFKKRGKIYWKWNELAPMIHRRTGSRCFKIGNDQVLAIGGSKIHSTSTEIYQNNSWTLSRELPVKVGYKFECVNIGGAKFLFSSIHSYDKGFLFEFDFESGNYTIYPNASLKKIGRWSHHALYFDKDKNVIYFIGGEKLYGNRMDRRVGILDLKTGKARHGPETPFKADNYPSVIVDSYHRILIFTRTEYNDYNWRKDFVDITGVTEFINGKFVKIGNVSSGLAKKLGNKWHDVGKYKLRQIIELK